MKHADLHLHTCYSHGHNSPWEMYLAACNKGLATIGFSEHSPRPAGFDYTHEYREQLSRYFPSYISEVKKLKELSSRTGGCEVLLGLEMDWLHGERPFVEAACRAHDYDYLVGSVHFLDHWGFDDSREDWDRLGKRERFAFYVRYFELWEEMISSGLFQIAAHPDIIKIFSVDSFHEWLDMPASRAMVKNCLAAMRRMEMAMEISSAGLRKACAEIYPCREIMRLASDVGVDITLASDAHNMPDVGADFDRLAAYAQSYGHKSQTVFKGGQIVRLPL